MLAILFSFLIQLPFDLLSDFVIYAESTDLVPWGSDLSTNVGYPRFPKLVSSMVVLSPYVLSVATGLILGDAWVSFSSKHHKNAHLAFRQSVSHFAYFWSVFTTFSHYCSSLPFPTSGLREGKRFFGVEFFTRALPCFTALHALFYINGVKIVPEEIFHLLDDVALAHWIMNDGYKAASGLALCTDSFTVPDVVRLMNVLMVKFGLDCTLFMKGGKYPRIFIRTSSMPRLRALVLPHMDPSMIYKLRG